MKFGGHEIVHPTLKELAERILRCDYAGTMLQKARRAARCGSQEVSMFDCPLMAEPREYDDAFVMFDAKRGARAVNHQIAASLLLYGLSVEDLTAVGG